METLKMNSTFIHILKDRAITHSIDRSVEDICSLSFFHLDHPEDTHPNYWEIHPDGDELLLVTKGELEIEIVTQPQTLKDSVPLNPKTKKVIVSGGESIIVKKKHWHRVVLKKETDLIVAGYRGNSKLAPVA